MLLAGCKADEKRVAAPVPDDAAITAALADPLMTDPDLVWQNHAHAAVMVAAPVNSALPPIDRSPEAIAAAQDAAARLVGGPIADAPKPGLLDLSALREAMTAAQMAGAARLARPGCLASIAYTARWAAMLPAPLEVYPNGAVEEAAGTDAAGCALRVVHFRTPVAVDVVVAFYDARLRAAGYAARHVADGADHGLRGSKAGVSYMIYVRPDESGLTAADIVVAGRG
jgi:hypothetical protein